MSTVTRTPRRALRLASLVAVVALVAALGACARPDPGAGGTTEDPAPATGTSAPASGGSTSHAAPTQDTTGQAPPDEEPRTDLTDQQVVEWTDYEVVSERELRFHFPTGTPECYGARTEVRQDGSNIQVATIVGLLPDAPQECSLVGRPASILVTTEEPVGDRTVEHLEVPEDELP